MTGNTLSVWLIVWMLYGTSLERPTGGEVGMLWEWVNKSVWCKKVSQTGNYGGVACLRQCLCVSDSVFN